MRKLYLILLALALVSCAKSPDEKTKMQGGQDLGGGDIILSTPDEVQKAIQRSLFYIYNLKIEESYNPLYLAGNRSSDEHRDLFLKVFAPQYPDLSYTLPTYFKKSKIQILQKGSCQGENERHPTASVDDHKIGANICISVEKLQETPRKSLERQIISLLIHEAAHLVGLREDDAKTIQTDIYNALMEEEIIGDPEDVSKVYRVHLSSAADKIAEILMLDSDVDAHQQIAKVIMVLTYHLPGDHHPQSFEVWKEIDPLYYQAYNETVLPKMNLAWATLLQYFSDEAIDSFDERDFSEAKKSLLEETKSKVKKGFTRKQALDEARALLGQAYEALDQLKRKQ